uniref:PHD-type domain-containing protein n=1 Tax=Cacopsylla melanoneura TaxID=428564 RepID=A0A8D8WHH0_9HEMI
MDDPSENSKDICPVCAKVNNNFMVECELCGQWVHAKCYNVQKGDYKPLKEGLQSFKCKDCGLKLNTDPSFPASSHDVQSSNAEGLTMESNTGSLFPEEELSKDANIDIDHGVDDVKQDLVDNSDIGANDGDILCSSNVSRPSILDYSSPGNNAYLPSSDYVQCNNETQRFDTNVTGVNLCDSVNDPSHGSNIECHSGSSNMQDYTHGVLKSNEDLNSNIVCENVDSSSVDSDTDIFSSCSPIPRVSSMIPVVLSSPDTPDVHSKVIPSENMVQVGSPSQAPVVLTSTNSIQDGILTDCSNSSDDSSQLLLDAIVRVPRPASIPGLISQVESSHVDRCEESQNSIPDASGRVACQYCGKMYKCVNKHIVAAHPTHL